MRHNWSKPQAIRWLRARSVGASDPLQLPFFYGWILVAVAFVTVGLGVNARTDFSLFFPPIVDEFGWERGLTAGAFAFGFLVSAALSPFIGRLMDRYGIRLIIETGVGLMGSGLLLASLVRQPWHLYVTLGVLSLRLDAPVVTVTELIAV